MSLDPPFPVVMESDGSVEICAVLDMAQTITVTAQIFTVDFQPPAAVGKLWICT